MLTKGLAYYSDCRGDQEILTIVREQLGRASRGKIQQAVAVTLQPIPWPIGTGGNLVLNLERGYLTMFRQQLTALEALETDLVFFCEHDVLYHPSHFDFTPDDLTVFHFNQNTWRVSAETGQALFYYCSQVSGMCAAREVLLDHYRRRVAHVEQFGFHRELGFEPGTNKRAQQLDGRTSATWMSRGPLVDIKTQFCLTPGRWNQADFRNKNSCLGWTESNGVPGWGLTEGRFREWLRGISATIPAR